MKYCYTDFGFPILDYFSLINKREFMFDWLIPIFASIGSYFIAVAASAAENNFLSNFLGTLTNLFAILVGFTIATLAIFSTAEIKKIEVLNKTSDREIRGRRISWFRFIYANLIYSSLAGILMLILTLLALMLTVLIKDEIIIPILVLGALHNLLITVRNTTNLYFIFFNQER